MPALRTLRESLVHPLLCDLLRASWLGEQTSAYGSILAAHCHGPTSSEPFEYIVWQSFTGTLIKLLKFEVCWRSKAWGKDEIHRPYDTRYIERYQASGFRVRLDISIRVFRVREVESLIVLQTFWGSDAHFHHCRYKLCLVSCILYFEVNNDELFASIRLKISITRRTCKAMNRDKQIAKGSGLADSYFNRPR